MTWMTCFSVWVDPWGGALGVTGINQVMAVKGPSVIGPLSSAKNLGKTPGESAIILIMMMMMMMMMMVSMIMTLLCDHLQLNFQK